MKWPQSFPFFGINVQRTMDSNYYCCIVVFQNILKHLYIADLIYCYIRKWTHVWIMNHKSVYLPALMTVEHTNSPSAPPIASASHLCTWYKRTGTEFWSLSSEKEETQSIRSKYCNSWSVLIWHMWTLDMWWRWRCWLIGLDRYDIWQRKVRKTSHFWPPSSTFTIIPHTLYFFILHFPLPDVILCNIIIHPKFFFSSFCVQYVRESWCVLWLVFQIIVIGWYLI